MYISRMKLIEGLADYSSPKSLITRMIKSKKIIPVRRGIFIMSNDLDYSKKSLANIIYGPSYLSFEYALAYHGLIPERVYNYTSASFSKNKNKTFKTPVGLFLYYYLPETVYPFGILQREENRQTYLIASPEKAICDNLYRVKGINSKKALVALLEEDWRIELQKLMVFDQAFLKQLIPLYRRKIHRIFLNWFLSEAQNG